MTINKKGGKHKHKKRVRNNPDCERRNPKHIDMPAKKLGTYFAKIVSRALGGRRFRVKIQDKQFDKELVAQVRGSKRMKYKCPRVIEGSYVIVSYSDYDKRVIILWVYKDWEVRYLKSKKLIIVKDDDDDNICAFVMEHEDDKDNEDEKPKKSNDNGFKDVYEELDFLEAQEDGDDNTITDYSFKRVSLNEPLKRKDKNIKDEIDFDSI